MTRDELLELAPLDAFALLDEYEAALYTRSFHHAAATVQAEVRELQAELSEDATFLSREEPRPLLRQKVLVRLQEEIEDAAESLQPLAQIGGVSTGTGVTESLAQSSDASLRSMLVVAGAVDGRNGFGGSAGQDAAMRELVAEIRARAAAGVKDRATPYWRAASFILAASLVVSLYFLARVTSTAEAVSQYAQQITINKDLEDLVPRLGDFAYRDAKISALASVDSSVNATASLIIDPKNSRALLVAFGLSSNVPFTLRAVDDQGNARVIASFRTSQRVTGVVASLPEDLNLAACKFEVLDSEGKTILRTA